MSKIAAVLSYFIIYLLSFSYCSAQETINFENDSWELSAFAKAQLNTYISKLRQNGPLSEITISGHTDSDGSEEYNKKLASARSTEIMNYLYLNGISNRMNLVSKGESSPLYTNDNETNKAKNRRVEISLSEKVYDYPLMDNHIQSFTIKSDRDTTVFGKKGTKIYFRKSAFLTNDLSSDITISLQEFYDKSSFVTSHLTTLTNRNKILESRGMIYIKAMQNGHELQLKYGSSFDILFRDRKLNDSTDIFYGDKRDGDIIWKENNDFDELSYQTSFLIAKTVTFDSNQNRVVTYDTLSTTVYGPEELRNRKSMTNLMQTSTKLGWINCDRFINDDTIKKDLYVEADIDFKPSLMIVFKDLNVVLPYSYKKDNFFVFRNIPLGSNVEIVGMHHNTEDADFLFVRKMYRTSNESIVKIEFESKTILEIKKELVNM